MTYQADRIFDSANSGQFPDEPLRLLDFGFEKKQEEYQTTTIAQSDCRRYLFVYTFRGKGMCRRQEDVCALLPGTAYLSLLPGESCYYIPDNNGMHEWEYFYVYFQGSAAFPFYRKIKADFGQLFSLDPDAAPLRLWRNLKEDCERGRQLRSYEGGEIVYRFLSCLLRTLEITSASDKLPISYVEQAVSYMQKHLADNFSMENLARMLGLSPSYFTRLFVKDKGMTPLNYLNSLRIDHAAFLLSNTLLPVDEVARKCGFSSGNYFCKVFRKALDYSPSEYRQRSGGLSDESGIALAMG